MKVELKTGEGLVRELSVAVPADRVQTEMEKKFVEVQQTTTLKGFRKGKAPMTMIKSMFANEVRADVVDELIKATLPEAVKDHELRVATRPTLTDFNFADDGGFNYTAQVEVFPEVGAIAFSGLKITADTSEISDKDVNEMVDYLRKRAATVRPVEREARDTDWVTVDLKKIADPKNVLQTDVFPNSEVDLSNQMTIKEFREQIPGMKVGEEKNIEVVYANDYSDQAFAGATITYACTLKTVKEVILPELDDSFAKQTQIGETLLEMRLKIREDLKRQRDDAQRRNQRHEIIHQMAEINAIPIPEGMVAEYLESVVEDFKKQYPKATADDETQIKQNYRHVGIEAMRWDIIWHQLSEQEKIEVLA
ncbi:MAG: trigger factor, partial [candidate division Zixibacteria bacterium]|nr:trigger factor [candidate division Zixibacteria bacterium]